jgi:hypothetical protein
MKNVVSAFILFALLCCVPWTWAEVPNFEQRLAQLDDFWRYGKIESYCAEAAKLTREVTAIEDSKSEAAMKLLQNGLAKEFGTKRSCLDALSGTEKLALAIMKSLDASPSDRQQKATLLAAYLGQIRSAQIPNFQALPVVANVSPPEGVPGFAGMDPNAISDPVAKAKYIQAIEDNERNNFMNKWQAMLAKIDRNVSGPLAKYLADAAQTGSISSDAIDKLINTAKLRDTERDQIKK